MPRLIGPKGNVLRDEFLKNFESQQLQLEWETMRVSATYVLEMLIQKYWQHAKKKAESRAMNKDTNTLKPFLTGTGTPN